MKTSITMPSGLIAAPMITPLRAPSATRSTNRIDSSIYIDLECGTSLPSNTSSISEMLVLRVSYYLSINFSECPFNPETPHCNIYFTTEGSKPNPFAQRYAGRDITFKFRAPFCLKPGKRTVKAVAVSKYLLYSFPFRNSKILQISNCSV